MRRSRRRTNIRRRTNTRSIPRKNNSKRNTRRNTRRSRKNTRRIPRKNTKRRSTKRVRRIRSRNRVNRNRNRRKIRGGGGGPGSRPSTPPDEPHAEAAAAKAARLLRLAAAQAAQAAEPDTMNAHIILPTPDGSGGVFVSELWKILDTILGRNDTLEFTDFCECITGVKLAIVDGGLSLKFGINTSANPTRISLTKDGDIIEYTSEAAIGDQISQVEVENYFRIFGINNGQKFSPSLTGGGKIYGGYELEIITFIEGVGVFLAVTAIVAIYQQEVIHLSERFKRYITDCCTRRTYTGEIVQAISDATKADVLASNNISLILSELNKENAPTHDDIEKINIALERKKAEYEHLVAITEAMSRSSLRLRVSSDQIEVLQADLDNIGEGSPVVIPPDEPGLQKLAGLADAKSILVKNPLLNIDVDVEAGEGGED